MLLDNRLNGWHIAVRIWENLLRSFLGFISHAIFMSYVLTREFDENLLRRISEIFYEDEVVNLPSAPDVSNYLMSEVCAFKLLDLQSVD